MDGVANMKKALAVKKELPGIYLAIGTEDFLYANVQKTRRLFEEHHIPYVYDEGSGSHTFEFWSKHIGKVIGWMLDDHR